MRAAACARWTCAFALTTVPGMSTGWWTVYAAGLLVHVVAQGVDLVLEHRGRRISWVWRHPWGHGRARRWSWVSLAGFLVMVLACGANLDTAPSAGGLLAGGVALGALGELVVAVVHNRRLRPEAAAV